MSHCWLTTIDNPFDPFVQFDDWLRYDSDMGYHTCELLARLAKTSNDLDEEAYSNAVDEAVKSVIRLNLNEKYKIVYEMTN